MEIGAIEFFSQWHELRIVILYYWNMDSELFSAISTSILKSIFMSKINDLYALVELIAAL